jgi:hypothetical protein
VELAMFSVGGGGGTTFLWHLLLVHQSPKTDEQFTLLLDRGGSLRKLGNRLADALGVPMEVSSAGQYDATSSQ